MRECEQNKLDTTDGTKVFIVEEYDTFLQAVPEALRYVEL